MASYSQGRLSSEEELLRRVAVRKQLLKNQDEAFTSFAKQLPGMVLCQRGCADPPIKPAEAMLDALQNDVRRWRRKAFPGFSVAECCQVSLITSCLPYFERLLEDRNRLQREGVRSVDEKLKELGYGDSMIRESDGKRSELAAVCAWLHRHGYGESGTFQNAYSKFARSMKAHYSKTIPQLFDSE